MGNAASQPKNRFFMVSALLLVSLLAACALTGCSFISGEKTPTNTVEQFTKCFSDLDMEGALECCDSETNAVVDGAFGLADVVLSTMGADTGTSSKQLAALLLSNITSLDMLVTGQEYDFSVEGRDWKERVIDGSHAEVSGTWVVSQIIEGKTSAQEGDVTFKLVKEDDGWKVDFSDEINSAISSMLR